MGKKEHAPADMRRTKVASRKFRSGDVIARSRQTFRDFGFPDRIAGRLLHDKPFCSGAEPDAQHFRPEAFSGSFVVNSGSDACALTGRPSDNEIGAAATEGSYIVVDWYAGKQMSEQAPSAWFNLDELHNSEIAVGVSQTECVASDIAKEVEDIHRCPREPI